MNSTDLFGCCGIRHGKNAVLNKNYSQQEYETLCGKIIDHMKSIGEWGEFFPLTLSPFGYNETVAQDYFPVSVMPPCQEPVPFFRREGWRETPGGFYTL